MAATETHSVDIVFWKVTALKDHGQALEQKHCFPGIFCDGCDASANLLNEFDGHNFILFYYYRPISLLCRSSRTVHKT